LVGIKSLFSAMIDDNYPQDKDPEVQTLWINGELDLHTFHPSEIKSLIPEYMNACLERNIRRIRIVHGKGTGVLRQAVHAILDKQPKVLTFGLADQSEGGWGATIVHLHSSNSSD